MLPGYKTCSLHLLACAIASLSTAAFAESEQKTLTLDARDLRSFRIDADEGFLHIQGIPGSDKIEVVAEMDVARFPYRLTLERRETAAVMVSDVEKHWPFSRGAYINLTVKVPDWLVLEITDDSGKIEVVDMRANVRIHDDSGSIVVHNQKGNVSIHDDSGDIELRSIDGDVEIEDDSGSVAIADIRGNVDIRDDSGAIRVSNVAGRVAIHDDSGAIEVTNVQQGLTIHERGSGRLTTSAIHGGIDIRD